ncbi:MAG TPA: hypothetical protein VGB08_00095 [Allosphingosinicella sp.]
MDRAVTKGGDDAQQPPKPRRYAVSTVWAQTDGDDLRRRRASEELELRGKLERVKGIEPSS